MFLSRRDCSSRCGCLSCHSGVPSGCHSGAGRNPVLFFVIPGLTGDPVFSLRLCASMFQANPVSGTEVRTPNRLKPMPQEKPMPQTPPDLETLSFRPRSRNPVFFSSTNHLPLTTHHHSCSFPGLPALASRLPPGARQGGYRVESKNLASRDLGRSVLHGPPVHPACVFFVA